MTRYRKTAFYIFPFILLTLAVFLIISRRYRTTEQESLRDFLGQQSQTDLNRLKTFFEDYKKFDVLYELKLPDGNWVYFAYRHIEGITGSKSETFIFCSNGEWYRTPFGFLRGELPTYLREREIQGANERTKGSIADSNNLSTAVSRIKTLKKIEKCGDFDVSIEHK